MTSRQRLCILGATGSVGMSTLEVVALHPERFEVVALTARQRVDELAALCERFRPRYAAVDDAAAARRLRERLLRNGVTTEVLHGPGALTQLAAHADVDAVMAAIVGAAGLGACLAAARAGKRLLLANKEALVVGGGLFMRAVEEGGATLLPVDSEHSAIFQCLPLERANWLQRIDHIVLTASGGPFRERDPGTLDRVTPDEACAHPNWVMGRKISVDSATLMNKGLELIEAALLFGLDPAQVEVVVHRQSIVHSLVEYIDGSVLAQLGSPDMRTPIAYALAWPERLSSGVEFLDLIRTARLEFCAPDVERFRCLALAQAAARAGGLHPAILNAANEVAVQAFLDRQLNFPGIAGVCEAVLQKMTVGPTGGPIRGLEDVLGADAEARRLAQALVPTVKTFERGAHA
jgi:1-deoxy-D-xylulose-5-phosphate reductoisomerase